MPLPVFNPAIDATNVFSFSRKLADANQQSGTTVAMTAGSVTVTGVTLTATSQIQATRNTPGGTVGHVDVPLASRNVGAGSFVIHSSSGTETSTFDWAISG